MHCPKPARYTRFLAAHKSSHAVGLLALASALVGCNTLDAVPSASEVDMNTPQPQIARIAETIPMDTRLAEVPSVRRTPTLGSNLLELGTPGAYLISDPARDRLSLVNESAVFEISLEAGSLPNRSVFTPNTGLAHVVLRGSGELLAVDVETGQWVARDHICDAPRGIAYDPSGDELVVACAEGTLLRHSADLGEYTTHQSLALPPDLRDVVVLGSRTFVSRFRSAQVLIIESGQLVQTVTLPAVMAGDIDVRPFEARVAWKMVAHPDQQSVVLMHQRATTAEISVGHGADILANQTTMEDGSIVQEVTADGTLGGSPYGGEASCDGIVHSAISRVTAQGEVTTSLPIVGALLPVDVAVQSGQDSQLTVSLVSAGTTDEGAPMRSQTFIGDGSGAPTVGVSVAPDVGSSVLTVSLELGDAAVLGLGCTDARFNNSNFEKVSVPAESVVNMAGVLAVVTTEPAQLYVFDSDSGQTLSKVNLGGSVVEDTGHTIFHRNSGGGIACASCHPEGGDDGHVWQFAALGPRRTQNLALPVGELAPFHWDGSLPDLKSLMSDVFVGRMGGVLESDERLDALQGWLSAARSPTLSAKDPAAAERGRTLFESSDVGCATCHSGPYGTNNVSYDVGTTANGERLQVPTLVGLALRPPYMHDGCAATLAQRFEPACGGGDAHGLTSQLSPADISDLIAYLEVL